MATITRKQIHNINCRCSNGWFLDVEFYLLYEIKDLIKQIELDPKNYLQFRLSYNDSQQVTLSIEKYFHKENDKLAVTSGTDKRVIVEKAPAKRKSLDNLIKFTRILNNEKLMKINNSTKVSSGYGVIINIEEF